MNLEPGIEQTAFQRIFIKNLIAPVILVVLMGMVFTGLVFQLLYSAQRVDHTDQVLAKSDQTLKLIVDSETAVRGYLLTGNPQFLQPYLIAVSKFDSSIANLKDLIIYNNVQKERLNKIDKEFKDWLKYAKTVTNKKEQTPSFKGFVAIREGKPIVDGVRDQFDLFISTAQQLRDSRVRSVSLYTKYTLLTIYFTAIATIFVIILSGRRQFFVLSQNYKSLLNSARDEKDRFLAIFEKSPFAMTLTKMPGGQFVEANDAYLSLFDFSREEIIGKTTLDLGIAKPEERVRVYTELNEKGYVRNWEYECKTRYFKDIYVLLNMDIIIISGERFVLATVQDITERKVLETAVEKSLEHEKEARLEAERANESKDIFLATLSHELRTPLTSIISWSQLVRRGNMSIEKLKQGMEIIERSAVAQSQLINDLLDVSRIHSGKLALNLTIVNPCEIVNEALKSMRTMATVKNIKIEVFNGIDIGKIKGDPARLQQVIWNLLTNSIKFSQEGGRIQVFTERIVMDDREFASIRVIDHGKGIDPNFLPRIFHRFSQQDSTSTRTHGGLGIGLSLVHDLVKSHGGSVKAESAGPGLGATFTVLLPIIENSDEKVIPIRRPIARDANFLAPDLTGLNVLIVEDEPCSLEAFAEVVKSFGGNPITSCSVKEAMICFEKSRPDIIVSDIAMPHEDGYDLIRKIRALPPEAGGKIPAIAVTAFASSHDVESALEAGFQDHLAKPIDNAELGRAIAGLVGVGSSQC